VTLPGVETAAEPWLRLDPRMLLVHPLREVVRFLPVLIGIVVAGTASGGGPWGLVGLGLPIGLGLVRYLTTSYRIAGGRVELRRGLVQRHTLSTPVDRVRTVDLTATVAHRVLGLATVVIGTGSTASDADERLELDGLPREQAAALRIRLLQAEGPTSSPRATVTPAEPVARFEARWLRYAPFTGTGLVATGAFAGAVAQASQGLDLRIDVSESDLAAVTGIIVIGGVLVVVLLVGLLTVAGYLVVNGGFALTRADRAWHIRRGLLTTRETSIDEDRVAGVSRGEHAALRVAHGARLSAIATGLGSRRNGATLVPAAPRATVETAAAAVLGTPAPMTVALQPHGPAASRRRYGRALLGTLPILLVVGVAVSSGASSWLLLALLPVGGVAVALGHDRARSLGHALADSHLVTRSGSLQRHRDALATDHVIGWTLRDTWFQRRAGLVTLHATTAGGSGQVTAPDVPASDAVVLADAATPGLLTEFLA
jgi:putative membrane protein